MCDFAVRCDLVSRARPSPACQFMFWSSNPVGELALASTKPSQPYARTGPRHFPTLLGDVHGCAAVNVVTRVHCRAPHVWQLFS